MGAVLGVEAVQVGGVLEVVGVEFTAVHGQVGLHIVGVDDDLQLVALLGQDRLGDLEDLGMRHRGGADADLYGFLLAAAAADEQRRDQHQR